MLQIKVLSWCKGCDWGNSRSAEEGASSSVLEWIKRLVVGCKIEAWLNGKILLHVEAYFTVSGIARWQTINGLVKWRIKQSF